MQRLLDGYLEPSLRSTIAVWTDDDEPSAHRQQLCRRWRRYSESVAVRVQVQRRHRQQLVTRGSPTSRTAPSLTNENAERVGVEDEHAVVAWRRACAAPGAADPRLRTRSVTSRTAATREHVVAEVQRAEADLDRELRTVGSPRPQLQAGAHGPHGRLGPETGAMRPMHGPQRLRPNLRADVFEVSRRSDTGWNTVAVGARAATSTTSRCWPSACPCPKTLVHLDGDDPPGPPPGHQRLVQARRGQAPPARASTRIADEFVRQHRATSAATCDFAKDIAEPYTLRVIMSIFGVPRGGRAR